MGGWGAGRSKSMVTWGWHWKKWGRECKRALRKVLGMTEVFFILIVEMASPVYEDVKFDQIVTQTLTINIWTTREQRWGGVGWTGKLGLTYHALLLLSHFSRVRLCATPETAATRLPYPGILQARTLEWVAISFPHAWKGKVKVKGLSRVRLLATPWTAAHQAPLSLGFSRQEHRSGVPSPSPIYVLLCIK